MFMRVILPFIALVLAIMTSSAQAVSFPSSSSSALPANTPSFVPVDQAFPFHVEHEDNTLYLDWQIQSGYYLYQDRVTVTGKNVILGSIEMPPGQDHHDEFFSDVTIYPYPIALKVPLDHIEKGAQITVQYQGCALAGFCYPPETRTINLTPATSKENAAVSIPTASTSTNDKEQSAASLVSDSSSLSGDHSLANELAEHWWTPLLFLVFGIGLAFTPCVLPMYPILTSLVLGGGKLSVKRALTLALMYVQGMAFTYTLLGLVVASAGMQFQAAMQHPYVLIGLSLLFIVLSLSMFGLYSLQLPSSIQTKLNALSNQQQGGNSIGVFAMGAISGLVCSPCTTAPLSGALLYVAQSGDLWTGAIALYALACGMGIPLIVAAVFGNTLLPKAGAWMERIKTLFGFILLAAPIFLLERLIPELWTLTLWSILGVVMSVWLFQLRNQFASKGKGWVRLLLIAIALISLVASIRPLAFYSIAALNPDSPSATIQFKRISTVEDLNHELAVAKAEGKPVMMDFYADWCVACKEFEKYTFHEANVEATLQNFVLLQADVTKSLPDDMALMAQLEVMGLPTIEFWDHQGNRIQGARLTGFVPADAFLNNLQQHHISLESTDSN